MKDTLNPKFVEALNKIIFANLSEANEINLYYYSNHKLKQLLHYVLTMFINPRINSKIEMELIDDMIKIIENSVYYKEYANGLDEVYQLFFEYGYLNGLDEMNTINQA